MTQQALNFLAAALAAVGLFFVAGSLIGFTRWGGIRRAGKGILGEGGAARREPLAVRLARVISEFLPSKKSTDPPGLLLSRAGYPFSSLAEFYQRKFVMLLLFAAAGMGGCLAAGMSPVVTLAAAPVAGMLGFFAPDSEVRERVQKRRRQLRREMAFMLDRVAFAVMAYGTFQEALARMSQADAETGIPAPGPVWSGNLLAGDRGPAAERRAHMMSLGSSVSGMGGGLFAEYLNRMASLLLGSAGIQFESIRQQLGMYYPSSPELQNFLDIVEAGLHGTPMVDRLMELTDAMILELEQEQREAGMKATSVVIMAAGAVLVPLLLVVGGPAFFLAISVFGG